MAFAGDIAVRAGEPKLLAGPVLGQVYFQNLGAQIVRIKATVTAEPPADFTGGWKYEAGGTQSLDVQTLMPGVPGAMYLWAFCENGTTLAVQYGDIEHA